MGRAKKKPYKLWKILVFIAAIIGIGAVLLLLPTAFFAPINILRTATRQDAFELYGAVMGAASAAWLGWLALRQSHNQQESSADSEEKFNVIMSNIQTIMKSQFSQQYNIQESLDCVSIEKDVLKLFFTSQGSCLPIKIVIPYVTFVSQDSQTSLLSDSIGPTPILPDKGTPCCINIPLKKDEYGVSILAGMTKKRSGQNIKLSICVTFSGDQTASDTLPPVGCIINIVTELMTTDEDYSDIFSCSFQVKSMEKLYSTPNS